MSFEQLAQEVVELRTQTLTPASPKPTHFPKPSNIPILNDMIENHFEEPGQSVVQSARIDEQNGQQLDDSSLALTEDTNMQSFSNNAAIPHTDDTSMLAESTDAVMSVDSIVQDQAVPQAAPPIPSASPAAQAANDAATAFLQSLNLPLLAAQSPIGDIAAAQQNAHDEDTNMTTDHAQVVEDLSKASIPSILASGGSGGVDLDALLNNLSASVAAQEARNANTQSAQSSVQAADTTSQSSLPPGIHQTPIHLIPTVASLPARPPMQANSHHAQDQAQPGVHSAQTQHTQPSSGTTDSVQPTSVDANGMPSPSAAHSHQQSSSEMLTSAQPQADTAAPATADEDEEEPVSPELQKQYEDFLADEHNFMTINEWEKFPKASRLFIGNLPSEKVSKIDIFRVFQKHGKLAQISIKQAYGFVQYQDAESCARALEAEQAVAIRGRKIHLEISKPQRNRNQNNDNRDNRRGNQQQRRSRSPDNGRRGSIDRYRGGDNNRHDRGRDGYRRSPSPRRGYRRSPDRYDGRRRSRSRSPLGRGGRYRSPDSGYDDGCPLPRRRPDQIPDIQIISQVPPERAFMQYVEQSFEARGIKCDVLLLSPKLAEAAVIRRQIIEGVHAVMKLERNVQYTNKFPLSIFDRSTPSNVRFEEYLDLDLNIAVELVLRAKQNAARNAQQQQYNPISGGSYGYGSQAIPPPLLTVPPMPPQFQQGNTLGAGARGQFPPRVPPPPISGIPTPSQLDPATLQRLLGQAQSQGRPAIGGQGYPQMPQSGQPGQPPLPSPADLARLLGTAPTPQQAHQPYGVPSQPMPTMPLGAGAGAGANSYQDLLSNPAIAALLNKAQPTPQPGQGQQYGSQMYALPQQQGQMSQQQGQQQQQGGQPDMGNLMAQLARYGGR